MTGADFVRKWKGNALTERSACQQHFLDLCDLVGHPKPADVDKTGETFTFERGASKEDGGEGWADVWKRGFFGWEYKGPHANLDKAYKQLLQYRESLENPPLLVTCDLDRLVVHTNFTGTRSERFELRLQDLDSPRGTEVLRAVFHEPDKLKPGKTSRAITEEAASRIGEIAKAQRGRGEEAHLVARFLDRVVFCMFAEDIELLKDRLFTRLLEKTKADPPRLQRLLVQLFEAMAEGGDFGADTITRFNGGLFPKEAPVPSLTESEVDSLLQAASLDWSAVDPSIFGTLFERGLDPDTRAQLGAHYTSREDIETLVEPVVMVPLRREWAEVQSRVLSLLAKRDEKKESGVWRYDEAKRRKFVEEATRAVRGFLERLATVRVLDPACGSGNFLYVTLQKLKDLEKAVCVWAMGQGLPSFLPQVHPRQLYGIEINPYAFELAQMTVWIGYLQWIRANGFGEPPVPVLENLEGNFRNADAILDLSHQPEPREPQWPEVDFIVSNPPFLGGKFLRRDLGDLYVDKLFSLWDGRVPREADLCAYWFEKARAHVEAKRCGRAGLLATQGIRGGANQKVLKSLKETGDIYFAESDRPWVLDGATVHISMVGFDDGAEAERRLDGALVASINADLTTATDLTTARRLEENLGIAFMGDTKGGAFDIPEELALTWLHEPNPNGRPNSDVLTPWVNGRDITARGRSMWCIDFGVGRTEVEAAGYERPFEYVRTNVKPERDKNKREVYRRLWWQHVEARPGMREALGGQQRFLATARVSKHRLFSWLAWPTLPDSQVFAFAFDDDFSDGLLHSKPHELWARRLGTQLREATSGARYTPTSCFETFTFPQPIEAQRQAVATAARELDDLRREWLNPAVWVKEEVLTFPGSVDGPWARYLADVDARGIGTARYPRLIPKDADCAKRLKTHTLTALYNQRPAWLDLAHRKLDEAVATAYGWPTDLTDDAILERLLALNHERAGR